MHDLHIDIKQQSISAIKAVPAWVVVALVALGWSAQQGDYTGVFIELMLYLKVSALHIAVPAWVVVAPMHGYGMIWSA